jgi:hypothetical protein
MKRPCTPHTSPCQPLSCARMPGRASSSPCCGNLRHPDNQRVQHTMGQPLGLRPSMLPSKRSAACTGPVQAHTCCSHCRRRAYQLRQSPAQPPPMWIAAGHAASGGHQLGPQRCRTGLGTACCQHMAGSDNRNAPLRLLLLLPCCCYCCCCCWRRPWRSTEQQ